MRALGKIDWAISGGCVPVESNGPEPQFISHDQIAILNTGEKDARLELDVFFEDDQPLGTFKIEVKAGRLRKVRFNDLIDPLPIELGRNYACLIQADAPVVVQFSRLNSGSGTVAEMGSMAFPVT